MAAAEDKKGKILMEKKNIDWSNLGLDTLRLIRDLYQIIRMGHGMKERLSRMIQLPSASVPEFYSMPRQYLKDLRPIRPRRDRLSFSDRISTVRDLSSQQHVLRCLYTLKTNLLKQ